MFNQMLKCKMYADKSNLCCWCIQQVCIWSGQSQVWQYPCTGPSRWTWLPLFQRSGTVGCSWVQLNEWMTHSKTCCTYAQRGQPYCHVHTCSWWPTAQVLLPGMTVNMVMHMKGGGNAILSRDGEVSCPPSEWNLGRNLNLAPVERRAFSELNLGPAAFQWIPAPHQKV